MFQCIVQRAFLVAAVVVFLTSRVSATDYWVDGLDGLDANDGLTIATAKKTIQAAVDLALFGDVVNVLPGEYSAGFALRGVGAEPPGLNDGVTVRAVGEVEIVSGENPVARLHADGARIEGFTFRSTEVSNLSAGSCS